MTSPIRDALSRLAAALDRLDAVSIRHVEAERVRSVLETELAVMREDRHDLARLVDSERALRLSAQASLEALLPRIDRAKAAIQSALADE